MSIFPLDTCTFFVFLISIKLQHFTIFPTCWVNLRNIMLCACICWTMFFDAFDGWSLHITEKLSYAFLFCELTYIFFNNFGYQFQVSNNFCFVFTWKWTILELFFQFSMVFLLVCKQLQHPSPFNSISSWHCEKEILLFIYLLLNMFFSFWFIYSDFWCLT